MSYTIEELVIIQRQAMEMALKATHMLGQRVNRHGDYPDDVDELQRRFAELHTVMLGDMEGAECAAGPLPAGWVAVPVEPTQDMIECGFSRARYNDGLSTRVGVYRAMIAAAPKLENAK